MISYDQAEAQGFIDDERFQHPGGTLDAQMELNQRRAERWQREHALGRGEVYLELAQLDLEDIESVLDFVSTFGVLDVRALDAPRMNRQWYGTVAESPSPFRILRFYPGFGDGSKRAVLDDALREAALWLSKRDRAAAPNWVIAETLDEFRWGARAVRDLYLAWRCLRSGSDPRDVSWANPRMPKNGDDLGRSLYVVEEFFIRTMRDALEGFSPRLWLVDEETARSHLNAHRSPAPADVALFEVLALELFRHIAEEAPWKVCENESCGRVFVRQDGGARYGQSRTTGVKYCSRRCADAVNQRRHRRRKDAPLAGT